MTTIAPLVEMKLCPRCKQFKPRTVQFFVFNRRGYPGWCVECNTQHTMEYRAKHPERVKEIAIKATRKQRATRPAHCAVIRAAHHAVEKALKSGGLVRPETCSRCSSPPVEAHHDDYSRPLDVVWFCRIHHKARHTELGWGNKPRVNLPRAADLTTTTKV